MSRTVDIEDLIDVHGVAALLGLKHRNSVTTYLRRYPDMPRPVIDFDRSRIRLWLRPEILTWARETGRIRG